MKQKIPELHPSIDPQTLITYEEITKLAATLPLRNPLYDKALGLEEMAYMLGTSRSIRATKKKHEVPKTTIRLLARLIRQFPIQIPPTRVSWAKATGWIKEATDYEAKDKQYFASMLGLYQTHIYSSSQMLGAEAGNLAQIYNRSITQSGNLAFVRGVVAAEAYSRGIDIDDAFKKGIAYAKPNERQSLPIIPKGIFLDPIIGAHMRNEAPSCLPMANPVKNMRHLFSASTMRMKKMYEATDPKEINPTCSLIIRALLSKPEYCPFPHASAFIDLVRRIQSGYPDTSNKFIYTALGLSSIAYASGAVTASNPSRQLLHLSWAILQCLDMYGWKFWDYYIDNIVNADAKTMGFEKNEIFTATGWNVHVSTKKRVRRTKKDSSRSTANIS